MVTADAGVYAVHRRTRHQLRFLEGRAYGLRHLLDVGDQVTSQPARASLAHSENREARTPGIATHLPDDRAGLGGAYVETGYEVCAHGSVAL